SGRGSQQGSTAASPAARGCLGEIGTDPARVLDVGVHLFDQRIDVVEGELRAQSLDEGDAQRLAVEVAVEVDQEGLDQDPEVGVEGGPGADVDRRRMAVGEGGVDPVPRGDEALVGDEVGGRETQRSAALVAFHDFALDHVGDAEAAARVLHVAGFDLGADPRGGDDLAVDLDQLLHPGLELRVRLQHRRVAFRLGAEVEVLADGDAAGAQLLDQGVLDELLRGPVRELLVEVDDDQLPDAEAVDHVALHLEGVDQLRRRLWIQDLERVRLEGQHGVGARYHRPVAEVDAVEGADRDVAGARLYLLQRGDL